MRRSRHHNGDHQYGWKNSHSLCLRKFPMPPLNIARVLKLLAQQHGKILQFHIPVRINFLLCHKSNGHDNNQLAGDWRDSAGRNFVSTARRYGDFARERHRQRTGRMNPRS
jgi:hypothetical protein